MKKIIFKAPVGLVVALATSHVLASGFALNEQSISGMGSGFAGRSSSAEDASTVFGNPAGMSRLKSEQVSLGAATLFAKNDISQTRSTFGVPGRRRRRAHDHCAHGLLRQAHR